MFGRCSKVLLISAGITLLLFSLTRHSSRFFPRLFQGFTSKSQHVRRHVAVTSVVSWHFEIYMGIVGILEHVLPPSASVQVYTPSPLRYSYSFDKIVDTLGLYHGNESDTETFFIDIDSTNLYPQGEMIDLIVLGTCESDLQEWHDRLLQSWDARPTDKKFQIACILHDADNIHWHDSLFEWVSRDAIRFLTISEHVSRHLQRNLRALAESRREALHSAGYEYVKTDEYIPVLDIPQKTTAPLRSLSNVAIQGSFRFERREYREIYADLLKSLQEDPRAWGYLPLRAPDSVYEVDDTAPLQPLVLHLIGNADDPQVPPALSNIIQIHRDLDYPDFYSLIQSMDLILPAFATLEYYEIKASFTMAISLECGVPILVNPWMRQMYSFLDDERVTVTRPHALREISAVKALRTGKWSPPRSTHPDVIKDVNEMIRKGWRRSVNQFKSFREDIRAQNEATVRRLLNGA